MTEQRHKGSCHCGEVQFEAQVDLTDAVSCNCSMCRRKGTLLAFIPENQFHLLSGEENLTDYLFGKKSTHHTFCSTCGVTAFASGTMPGGKPMRAINLRCIEGIDLDQVEIRKFNGKDI